MSKLEYYVIDTETTGLKAGHNEVTEISIVRCRDRHQLTRQIRAEFPERANDVALRITGKTFEDLLEGDDKEDVVNACNLFFNQDGLTPEHRCIVAHNAPFDKRFCHALWESCGQQFPAIVWLCTIKLSKLWSQKLGSKPENFQLGTMLKYAGIKPMPGAHDAGSDARNTYLLWSKGMASDLDYLQATKRYPHNIMQKEGSVTEMDIDMADIY